MPMEQKLARLIDANANRAREGLRVIEEVARMLWDNERLTREIKGKRHKITELMHMLPITGRELLLARDSGQDVGRTTTVKNEQRRDDLEGLLISNFKRVEEALRVLEEFLKLENADCAEGFKALRFGVYDIEKKMITGK